MAPPKKPLHECVVEGCTTFTKHDLYCTLHYKRWWRHSDPLHTELTMHKPGQVCKADGCGEPAVKREYCENCYRRFLLRGTPERVRNANGEGSTNTLGYRVLGIKGERVYEHTLIAERALGRPLPPGAVVHHVTEWKDDNYGPFKLVICPDQAYHLLIHRLMKEKGISFRYGWPNEENYD